MTHDNSESVGSNGLQWPSDYIQLAFSAISVHIHAQYGKCNHAAIFVMETCNGPTVYDKQTASSILFQLHLWQYGAVVNKDV